MKNQADLPAGVGYINLNNAGNSFSFAADVDVATGDVIDFAIGPGSITPFAYLYDVTAIDAAVCSQ